MAETIFDTYFYRGLHSGDGVHFGRIYDGDDDTYANTLPTLSADGLSFDGKVTEHAAAIFLVKILDDTIVNNIELLASSSNSAFTTNRASGIVIAINNVSFQSKNSMRVFYWDSNIANGQSSFDYSVGGKTHMIDTGSDFAYNQVPADADFVIRNYDNTEDVLVASDVKVTQDIYDTYFDGKLAEKQAEGVNLSNWFSTPTPSGYGLSVSHEERRRMWVLGYNVRNV